MKVNHKQSGTEITSGATNHKENDNELREND